MSTRDAAIAALADVDDEEEREDEIRAFPPAISGNKEDLAEGEEEEDEWIGFEDKPRRITSSYSSYSKAYAVATRRPLCGMRVPSTSGGKK